MKLLKNSWKKQKNATISIKFDLKNSLNFLTSVATSMSTEKANGQ